MTRRTFKGTPSALVLILAAVAGCATAPRGVDKEAKPADIDSLKSVGGKANALVVFASSRVGTSHIFSMKSDGSDLKQLTKGGLTDWNPRFSPDGSKILFSRSVEKGARETDVGVDHAWDLFTISTGAEEPPAKIVANATWGSWIANDEILFVRGSKIMRMKLGGESSEEKKVMDLSRHAVFEGAVVRDPELSRDGHEIAMTLGGIRRQVGIWSLKKKAWTQVGPGAQITWFPDGSAVAWISPTGKELSEVVRVPIVEGEPPEKTDAAESKLVDLQGKRSREAFPRLSPDGKWLVFASAVGSAEPDLEDYELYLWEIGSSESPTRLTFNSASDRWPDVFAGAAKEAAPKTDEAAGGKAEEGAAAAEPAEKPAKAGGAEGAAEPADKAEAEKKEEPAAAPAETTPDEGAEPAPAKAKAKPKAAKKKRR